MQRRSFIGLVGGGVVAAAVPTLSGCSSDVPQAALQAWKGPEPNEEIRKWILSYALLAPNAHNLQSWLVDLGRPGEIVLYCDTKRLLPETDPQHRQIMLTQGTFLELLSIAARERGLNAQISLFPNGAFDVGNNSARPVALIKLIPDASVTRDPLFAQVMRRRTNRELYSDQLVPPSALQAIRKSLAGSEVTLGAVDANASDLLRHHRELAMEAFRIELLTPRTMMESLRVIRVGPTEIAEHRDGISLNKPMPRLMASLGLFDRSKAPAANDTSVSIQLSDFQKNLNSTHAFLWLTSKGNSRETQVNAGRAYVRAQLAATAQGLSMQPLSQALQEYPEQAPMYAAAHRLMGAPIAEQTVQMWVRLGYAPSVQPSPRRGLAHLVMM
jgi:hypothetical protein